MNFCSKRCRESPMSETNPITRPAHYVEGRTLEPIDVIEDWKLPHHLACVLKYISRAGRKDDIKQDIDKALWYLKRYRETL
jgi:hypothetical protein